VRLSVSRAARWLAFTPSRYSSMVLGLPAELVFLLVIVFSPLDHLAFGMGALRNTSIIGTEVVTALFRRLLQFFDVEPDHLEHGFHDTLRFCGVFIAQQLTQHSRDNLPGESVFVFEPAALHLL